jgi:hypothetical protein
MRGQRRERDHVDPTGNTPVRERRDDEQAHPDDTSNDDEQPAIWTLWLLVLQRAPPVIAAGPAKRAPPTVPLAPMQPRSYLEASHGNRNRRWSARAITVGAVVAIVSVSLLASLGGGLGLAAHRGRARCRRVEASGRGLRVVVVALWIEAAFLGTFIASVISSRPRAVTATRASASASVSFRQRAR